MHPLRVALPSTSQPSQHAERIADLQPATVGLASSHGNGNAGAHSTLNARTLASLHTYAEVVDVRCREVSTVQRTERSHQSQGLAQTGPNRPRACEVACDNAVPNSSGARAAQSARDAVRSAPLKRIDPSRGATCSAATLALLARGTAGASPREQAVPLTIAQLEHEQCKSASAHVAPQRDHLQRARVVGQVSSKVIITKAGSVILAIDQHAADERVRLERLQRDLSEHMARGIDVKPVIPPASARSADAGAAAATGHAAEQVLGRARTSAPVHVQLSWHQLATLARHRVRVTICAVVDHHFDCDDASASLLGSGAQGQGNAVALKT